MKKALYLLAVGALALTACTSEEVKHEGIQSNAIKFNHVVNKDSRALDMNSFGKFFVYGYYTKDADLTTRFNIFTDTEVNKGSDGVWSSAINRYWIDGCTYSFYAYSCENKHIAPTYGGPSLGQNDGVFTLNYTCHAEGGQSHDLLFASATNILGKAKDNDAVPFQFKHILTKADLNFISEFPEGYNIEISNISISNFKNDGTFTAAKNPVSEGAPGSWGDVNFEEKAPNSFGLNTLKSAVTTAGGEPVVSSAVFLIPHHYGGQDNPVKIQFNIKVTNPTLPKDQQTILSNTLTGTWKPNWRMGTYYTYKIRLSGGAAGMDSITFGVSVDDWNEPQDDNKPEDIQISLDYQLTTIDE